jgi:hypothetical protein
VARSRVTWLIIGGVAALLLLAGVDALRSSLREAPVPASAAEGSALTTSTDTEGPVGNPSPEDYVAQARVLCGHANAELMARQGPGFPETDLTRLADWHAAAVIHAAKSIKKLRALPRPDVDDRVLLNEFLAAAEREIDRLRSASWAAHYGYRRDIRLAMRLRVEATRDKAAAADRLTTSWGLEPGLLEICPLALPG